MRTPRMAEMRNHTEFWFGKPEEAIKKTYA
jgi:hypothetical protein